MEYKGVLSRIEFDDEANIFHGEVINIRDVITFQGNSVGELRTAFEDSVEEIIWRSVPNAGKSRMSPFPAGLQYIFDRSNIAKSCWRLRGPGRVSTCGPQRYSRRPRVCELCRL